jgi:hypothetical protein
VQNVICQPGTAQINTWTHLVGVYDAATGMASLYVNGTLVTSVDLGADTPWNATGAFALGRTRWNDSTSDWFTGDIDAVHLYQGALSIDDIQDLAGN